jgi:methyl coenzyme M reductase alpha subunit
MAFKMKGSPLQRNFGVGTSPMKQEETLISSVTGKPYPPYVMNKSPEGEYSARQQAMESFDKMKFAEKSSSDELTDKLLDETKIEE